MKKSVVQKVFVIFLNIFQIISIILLFMENKALFPGSFDPIHEGHINIVKRAAKLFDKLYVAVSINIDKNSSNILERFEKLKITIDNLKINNVKVILNDGLTVKKAQELGCKYIIRSIRNESDYKYELDMAKINFALNNGIETILMIADSNLKELSSTNLKKMQSAIERFK